MLLALISLISGCAQYDKSLKTEAGIHVPLSNYNSIAIDPDIKEYITIKLIKTNGEIVTTEDGQAKENNEDGNFRRVKNRNSATKTNPAKIQAVYYSIDTTKLMGVTLDKTKRNKIIEILVLVSDLNSETYLSRSYAAQLYINSGVGFLERITTAVQTGTTKASPGLSAGLGISNLLIGGVGEELNSTVYANNTYEAIQESIKSERAKRKIEIINGMDMDYDKYTIQDALSDIRYLAEVSSVRVGVGKLLQDARNKKDIAEGLLQDIKNKNGNNKDTSQVSSDN